MYRTAGNIALLHSSFLALALLAAGCWTFNETPYPEVEIHESPAGTNLTVAVTGFAATLTDYATVHEFHTVYVPGYVGRRYCRPGYFETVPTVAYVPQARPTDMFQRRAKDEFEKAGFTVGAPVPDWTVDVEFTGPIVTTGDAAKQAAWVLCTLFFCDYNTATWTAKLRVRDNRTGRLVFHRDYVQRYETNSFGIVPLFGISSCPNTSMSYMQSWCLGALTDMAVADAASYLAGGR
jgi:hypothetical protein